MRERESERESERERREQEEGEEVRVCVCVWGGGGGDNHKRHELAERHTLKATFSLDKKNHYHLVLSFIFSKVHPQAMLACAPCPAEKAMPWV